MNPRNGIPNSVGTKILDMVDVATVGGLPVASCILLLTTKHCHLEEKEISERLS